MEVLFNETLKNKTTFHVAGVAKKLWLPNSEEDLVALLAQIKGEPMWIISGGSNLIINDKKIYPNVISMKNVDTSFVNLDEGRFYIGASLRIQKVITMVNAAGYGGFEELIGLPALFGGIIYMNAGIGGRKSPKFNISDFIIRVKVLNRATSKIEWIDKEYCGFGYRLSIFQNDKYIILGAEIQLNQQDTEVSTRKIKDRRAFIKKKQVFGKGCFGSCFCQVNSKLLRIVYLIPKSFWGGVEQAPNNGNWLVNKGNCTFRQVMRLINLCILLHKLTFQKCRLEVRIWK